MVWIFVIKESKSFKALHLCPNVLLPWSVAPSFFLYCISASRWREDKKGPVVEDQVHWLNVFCPLRLSVKRCCSRPTQCCRWLNFETFEERLKGQDWDMSKKNTLLGNFNRVSSYGRAMYKWRKQGKSWLVFFDWNRKKDVYHSLVHRD